MVGKGNKALVKKMDRILFKCYNINMNKIANHTLTLEQIALVLKNLPKDDIGELDLMLDDDLRKKVLARSKTADEEFRQGNTLSMKDIKQEFNV